tara:strand:- start:219 stop:443 length:225 start_codon:yes stop_codon:yes gene_type:complete
MELKKELLEITQKQYNDLKEECKFDNVVGAENEQVVIFKSKKYNITVIGFWEKQNWFEFLIVGADFKYSGNFCY